MIASKKPASGMGRVERRMIPEGITQIRVGREPRSGERGGIRKQGMRYVSGYFRSGDRDADRRERAVGRAVRARDLLGERPRRPRRSRRRAQMVQPTTPEGPQGRRGAAPGTR